MNKFLQTCLGAALVLFAIGFVIRSVQPAASATVKNNTTTINDDPFCGIGVADGFAYYLVKEQGTFYKLKKIELSQAQTGF